MLFPGLLSFSVRSVPLGVTYAVWGGLGILGTALLSYSLDGVQFTPQAWAGVGLILLSVATLHLSV